MKNNSSQLVIAAALGGLLSGSIAAPAYASSPAKDQSAGKVVSLQNLGDDKHDCKGKNGCKGHGNCKSGDNGCKGKNSCKGKGGCKSSKE
jgi:hypothetical protein